MLDIRKPLTSNDLISNIYLLLLTCRSLLRSLQRIDRAGTGKAATLSRRRLRLGDHDVTVTGSGYCAFHHQQVVFRIDAADAKVANRNLVGAEVAGHALAREHSRRERRSADRALDLEHM